MIRPWTFKHREIRVQNRIFTLTTQTLEAPSSGREYEVYVLEAGDWVNVIPVTPDHEVLLVRQFRFGTREVTLEIPGGLVEDGQTPAEAAARELSEETGYRADTLIPLGRVRPNPAILTNWCHLFLAPGVIRTGDMDLDEMEEIELVRAPLAAIPDLIQSGAIDHSLVLAAFCRFYLDGWDKKL